MLTRRVARRDIMQAFETQNRRWVAEPGSTNVPSHASGLPPSALAYQSSRKSPPDRGCFAVQPAPRIAPPTQFSTSRARLLESAFL